MSVSRHIQKFTSALLAVFVLMSAPRAAEPFHPGANRVLWHDCRNRHQFGKAPLGGVTVTAVRTGGGIHAAISASDGVYSFADLPVGMWSLTATVEGYPESLGPTVSVVAGKATRDDIAMNVPEAPVATAPALASAVPEALQSPEPSAEVDLMTPWADVGYIGWMNGTSREKAPIFDTKFFTPEIRLDMNYLQSLNHPQDHTIVGSTEEFRSGEFQIEQVSLGGDFHWDNVRARFFVDVRHVRDHHTAQ